MTTTLPFTVLVWVVTTTPDPLVVATVCDTCGPPAPFVAAVPPTPVVDAALAAGRRAGEGVVSQRHGGGPGADDERGRRPVRHPPDAAHTITAHPHALRSRAARFRAARFQGRQAREGAPTPRPGPVQRTPAVVTSPSGRFAVCVHESFPLRSCRGRARPVIP